MSFWKAKTKIRNSDRLFSEYIRRRDGWRCQYRIKCYGNEDFSEDKGALTNSHFIKRANEAVRFEPLNCDSACRKCHQWIEDTSKGAAWLKEWKLKQLGEQKYRLLQVQAFQTRKKRDDKLDVWYAKLLLKELKK